MGWWSFRIYGTIRSFLSQLPRCVLNYSCFYSRVFQTLSSKVGDQGGAYYTSPPGSSKYGDDAFGRDFKISQVSREARESDNGEAKRFWELSEKLVGI